MADSAITENQARALIAEMRKEIDLAREQITKSRSARDAVAEEDPRATTGGTTPLVKGHPTGSPSRRAPPLPPDTSDSQAREPAVSSPPSNVPTHALAVTAAPSSSPAGTSSPPQVPVVRPITATRKQGALLRLARRTAPLGLSTPQLVPQYVVVDENVGVALYASQEAFESSPSRPQRRFRFWIETANSRGSRFKRAAVCWPLFLPEDGDELQGADPSYTYFGIDFPTEANRVERVVFAVRDPRERDDWVHFLTKYIDMYLAPREESHALQFLPRGAEVPRHRSSVLEGEAPGGTVL